MKKDGIIRLAKLAKQLREFDIGDANRDIRIATERLIKEGFRFRRSPYGKPWAPQARNYGNPLMDKSGAHKSGWKVDQGQQAGALSVKVTNAAMYSGYHETGTSRMPARPSLPNERGGMPVRWLRAYERILVTHIRKETT